MSTSLQTKISRFGLSLVFIVFGIWEIMQPGYWIGFVPAAASAFGSLTTLVIIHGIILLIVGVPLLFGFYQRIFAAVAALILLAIIFSLFMMGGVVDIAVRDIALFFVAVSLVV